MKRLMVVCFLLAGFILSGSLFADTVTQEWVATYNGPGNGSDTAYAIALDTLGNVYVAGYSAGSGTGFDFATVKYDTNGNQLWAATYNGPGNSNDYAHAIAIDTLGNVYVTGKSYDDATGYDYATIKYDTDGNQLWLARYNGPGNPHDSAYAIAVDTLGNVYVTGNSATVKYDTDGNQLWATGGSDSIAIDDSGNVYVAGGNATVKYDTDGNQLWVATYNGPGNYDVAIALALDTLGNVYVTGKSVGSGTSLDYATVKYDTDGNELWVARYDGPGNSYDFVTDIAIDDSGNVYVTGRSYGSGTGRDYATVKYDSDGNQLWVARYNHSGNFHDSAYAIAVDTLGNVYVTGGSRTGGYISDYATVKYDTDGNELWVARYDDGGDGDTARAIALDTLGNVYVTGRTGMMEGASEYTTVKYSQGNTPAGTDVVVTIPLSETESVTIVFSNVTTAGNTTVTVTETGPPPPSGFKLLGKYYDINTTAVFDGLITVSIHYDDTGLTPQREARLKLKHFDIGWVDVTTSRDTEGDVITGTVTSLSPFAIMYLNQIEGEADINPKTINKKSKGNYLTAYIELPQGYDVADIDLATVVMLAPQDPDSGVPIEPNAPTAIGDNDHDSIADLMVKFDRQAVQDLLSPGDALLTVRGQIPSEDIEFTSSEVITVKDVGKEHVSEDDHSSVEY